MGDPIFNYRDSIITFGIESFSIDTLLTALCVANTVKNMCLDPETDSVANFVFDAAWQEIEKRAS